MSHKLGICIPYRNRKEHIDNLIPALAKHLNKQGIDHAFYVGHQIDEKLFNRGAMKNIAAHVAFEDGCDYVAWHDVDMLPHPEADYSYPQEHPTHIATKLSKYNYGLGYDQYFGGVVLFTKEQAEKTNGYSNDYWDWGQEDDDLFWRCYFEGMTTGNVYKSYHNKAVANFDGESSKMGVEINREISSCLSNDHTISILFSAEQQPEKVPIWLVGDEEKKFIEYPILRKDGAFTWGLSFNNSRSVNMAVFDRDNVFYYNWAKKFENVWTWVSVSYNSDTKQMYMYVNDELVTNQNDIKENKPFQILNSLKPMDAIRPLLLGFCSHTGNHFKGKIAHIKIFDAFFENIEDSFKNNQNVIFDIDFENGTIENKNEFECLAHNLEITKEDIEVIDNVLPFRKESKFDCMFHADEGFVNGKWAKGETTARNEKRFVTEMQQGLINYKNDGINNILNVLKIEKIDVSLYDNTKFINVKMI
jgi:hypothetical protein